jgi:signal transduction histidine kinase/CheY-like chemotaxis protein
MNVSFLREFMVLTPTCFETASLSEIWQCFQQAEVDQLIVLNDHLFPLGLLRLCRLLPFFAPEAPHATPRNQITLADHWTLLDPITVIWEETEITQLQTQLATLSQQAIVLVNASGQYVGQLDQLQVLQQFALKSGGRLPASDPALPEPLVDLLEHLPLPLMLQTATGHLITQNLAWRQQVGAIQQPQRIHRAAAKVLEVALTCKTKPRSSATVPARKRSAASTAVSQGSRSTTPNPLVPALVTPAGACRLGAEPNVCICVCPMKEGHDRVWQFVRIPMGMPTEPGNRGHAESASEPWSVVPFKLASLKFCPDPNWRSLLQTEALWLVLAQDVTEQQQVAKELTARNADLVQLNRLKDEFLACISHELKTPLTAVLGMSSLLKDQLLGELNERQAHYAQLIYRSGRHLVAIINNILDLTRIETGQLELSLEPLHIPTLCQQAYEHAQQQQLVETNAESTTLPPADHPFQLEVQSDLQYMVADELRLRQMLINLIANAIKFTQPANEIGLRVESWEGWIAFTVWDTGIGIPPEKQHLIFQKFQQLEPPLTRQFRGTGLGLVLTQRLARLHGGDITFTSVLGKGSEFTLLLPPVPPQMSDFSSDTVHLPKPALMQTGHNRLVLIVEMDAEQLETRVTQLTELGYRAIVARSGTEAIEKARRLQPAAILLNAQLPLLSGWDVVTLLKADETTRKIPIVMIASRVERNQAYQHGVDQFLSLPVDLPTLEHCLDQFILPNPPELPDDAMTDLTVLHLYEGNPSLTLISAEAAVSQELNHLLYPYHCRVLEVDDLEQANLLARVWKPDVVLIDQTPAHPQQFMRQLSQASFLAELPLITFSAEVTQAANQIPSLTVFPYLAQGASDQASVPIDLAELVQVIQLAVGIYWTPQILITDCSPPEAHTPEVFSSGNVRPPVRALMQYLQTAGFRSAINNDWQKVKLQLQHQGVDLLLLCVSLAEPQSVVEQIVQALQQLPDRPPILVWNYQSPDQPVSNQMVSNQTVSNQTVSNQTETMSDSESFNLWSRIAAEVLPASLPISELLSRINQQLTRQRQSAR